MKLLICDRCKGEQSLGIQFPVDKYQPLKDYDLCGECYKEFFKWMRQKK